MGNSNGIQCANIQKLGEKEKKRFLRDQRLPANSLDITVHKESKVHKFVKTYFDDHKNVFYTVAYSIKDTAVYQELFFHFGLSRKLKSRKFLPFNVQCFADDSYGYLVFSPRTQNSYFYTKMNTFTLWETKTLYLEIVRVFKKLSHWGIALSEFDAGELLVTDDKKVQFNPLLIQNTCQINQKCYVPLGSYFAEKALAERGKAVLEESDRPGHVFLTPAKNWNIIVVVLLMRDYIRYYNNEKMNSYMFENIEYFRQKLETLAQVIESHAPFDYQWSQIITFVDSWGKNGSLADFVGNIQKYQIDESKNVEDHSSLYKDNHSEQKIYAQRTPTKTQA